MILEQTFQMEKSLPAQILDQKQQPQHQFPPDFKIKFTTVEFQLQNSTIEYCYLPLYLVRWCFFLI